MLEAAVHEQNPFRVGKIEIGFPAAAQAVDSRIRSVQRFEQAGLDRSHWVSSCPRRRIDGKPYSTPEPYSVSEGAYSIQRGVLVVAELE